MNHFFLKIKKNMSMNTITQIYRTEYIKAEIGGDYRLCLQITSMQRMIETMPLKKAERDTEPSSIDFPASVLTIGEELCSKF